MYRAWYTIFFQLCYKLSVLEGKLIVINRRKSELRAATEGSEIEKANNTLFDPRIETRIMCSVLLLLTFMSKNKSVVVI